ncbi:MAG: hypothetical protein ACE5OZ_07380 [Candidatus Heimdallarchaeota archaeon]
MSANARTNARMRRNAQRRLAEDCDEQETNPRLLVRTVHHDGQTISLPVAVRRCNAIEAGDEVILQFVGVQKYADADGELLEEDREVPAPEDGEYPFEFKEEMFEEGIEVEDQSIEVIKGHGPVTTENLEAEGIYTVGDFLKDLEAKEEEDY